MTIATRAKIFHNLAAGKGYERHAGLQSPTATYITATAASGLIGCAVRYNNIGTTFMSTLQGITVPTTSAPLRLISMVTHDNGNMILLVRIYRFGTVDLTAIGNSFTHDAGTFPVTRTQYGQVSQPVNLIPLFQLTTSLATTAAEVRFRTVLGAAGYTNQANASVVGTQTFVFPSATTPAGSCYIPMLERGDSGVRDITNVEVTVVSTAGVLEVYGMELLTAFHSGGVIHQSVSDTLFRGLGLPDLQPAVATSGSITSHLVQLGGQNSNAFPMSYLTAVHDV
mgnify:CR=1 FL=1